MPQGYILRTLYESLPDTTEQLLINVLIHTGKLRPLSVANCFRGTASGPRADKFRRMLAHLLLCRFYLGISAAFLMTFLNKSEK